jgi:hypothetical protein
MKTRELWDTPGIRRSIRRFAMGTILLMAQLATPAWGGLVFGTAAKLQFQGFTNVPTLDTYINFSTMTPGTRLTTQIGGVSFQSNIGTQGETPFGPYYVYLSTSRPGQIVGSPCNGCVDDGRVGYQIVFATPQRRAGLQRIWNTSSVTRFYNASNQLLAEHVNTAGSEFVGFIADSGDAQTGWVVRIQMDGLLSSGVRQVGYSADLFFGSASAASSFTPSLQSGFNLLGNALDIPLDVVATFGNQDSPLAGVTTNTISVWKWNATQARWAFYSPQLSAADNVAYSAIHSYDALSTINAGEGYWVNVIDPMTLPAQTGNGVSWGSAEFSVLGVGFNLIATIDAISPSQFSALVSASSSPAFATLWAWNTLAANWYFYSPLLESSGGLAAVKSYANTHNYLHFQDTGKLLGIGTGFWVNKL